MRRKEEPSSRSEQGITGFEILCVLRPTPKPPTKEERVPFPLCLQSLIY
jgi:hypothetical protein